MSPSIEHALLQAAVERDRRRREFKPGDFARYAGRYRGKHCDFVLEWVEEECGYRRRFDHDSLWRWEDPTILSTAEVRARLISGALRPVVQGNFPGGVERA